MLNVDLCCTGSAHAAILIIFCCIASSFLFACCLFDCIQLHRTKRCSSYVTDLPLLRLVPKSELMASFRKDSPNNAGGSKTDSSESNNNNCSSSNLNNNNTFLLNSTSSHFMVNSEMKFSPPPHLLSPQSNASGGSNSASAGGTGDSFSGTPPTKPAPTRRRVRRRATSSSDPAEQLTEMSVRGLNLFRYACIDEGVYKCLECAKTDIVKTFKNKYSFQRHAFLYHEGCQRKVFPCPVCGKEFSRPDKMKNHMKTVHDCFMPKECMVPKDILFPPPPPIPFFLSPP